MIWALGVLYGLLAWLIGRRLPGHYPPRFFGVVAVTFWAPVTIAVYAALGFWLAKTGDCEVSARAYSTCIVNGFDVSEWVNSLVFSGYLIALFAIPWAAFFGLATTIYSIVAFVQVNSKPD